MSPSAAEIKGALASLSPNELKEIKLLSEHLLGGPAQTSHAEMLSRPEALILHELETLLGLSASQSKRINAARNLYVQLNSLQLAKSIGTDGLLRMIDVVLLAMSECAKEDGLALTWDTVLFQTGRLSSILERQFPHYRSTGILTKMVAA